MNAGSGDGSAAARADQIAQAKADASPRRVPVVAHRMNRREWVAVVDLADFLLLYGYAKVGHEAVLGEPMEGDDGKV